MAGQENVGVTGDQCFALCTRFVEQINDILHVELASISAGAGQVRAGIRKEITTTLVLLGLATVLAGAVGFLALRKVVNALDTVRKTSVAMADGDLNLKIDIGGTDDIGRTAEAMNMMIARLQQKAASLRQVAEGNLTENIIPASERDALGMDMARMQDSLRNVLTEVIRAASLVQERSGQMAGTSASLSQAASEQAATLEEISSALREVASRTKDRRGQRQPGEHPGSGGGAGVRERQRQHGRAGGGHGADQGFQRGHGAGDQGHRRHRPSRPTCWP